jgi:hypothetical protein
VEGGITNRDDSKKSIKEAKVLIGPQCHPKKEEIVTKLAL